jgi:hypothetical protein
LTYIFTASNQMQPAGCQQDNHTVDCYCFEAEYD